MNGIHVNLNGKTNVPNPIEKFEQLIDDYKISPKLYNNILNCGYKTPTSIQMQAIPSLLSVNLNSLLYYIMIDSINYLYFLFCLYRIIQLLPVHQLVPVKRLHFLYQL